MGVDVYLRWDGMTKEEHDAQITGWSIVHGHVGYLREAYSATPFATNVLISEDWKKQPPRGFVIKNEKLLERLPEVEKTVRVRYDGDSKQDIEKYVKAYRDFVKLHGEKEKAGLHPKIEISY